MAITLNPSNGSVFMRPFALGWTAYVFGMNALFLLTRGGFHSPDSWAELYTLVLATYAGGPEVKRWVNKTNPLEESDDWLERLRKGGPFVLGWNLLLAVAGALRMYDASWPMPPELKSITMQVTALFFGTYALRQVRKRAALKSGYPPGPVLEIPSEEEQTILGTFKLGESQTPAEIASETGISRRTITRLLAKLTAEGKLLRQARYPTDPTATYKLP